MEPIAPVDLKRVQTIKPRTLLCLPAVVVIAIIVAYMVFTRMTPTSDVEMDRFKDKPFIVFEGERNGYREVFLLDISDEALAERGLTKEDVVDFFTGLIKAAVSVAVEALSETIPLESSNDSIDTTPVELDDNKIKALNKLLDEGIPYEIRTYNHNGELVLQRQIQAKTFG